MDYRDLLWRYMRLVIREEGISFLNHAEYDPSHYDFTEAEMQILREIETEAEKRK